jgi:hypothetical protein
MSIGAKMAGGNPASGFREQDDFYPTPIMVTEALLQNWTPTAGKIWEPAAGNGAMVKVLERRGYIVVATDLVDRGYGGGADFLRAKERLADCIITNAPFNLAPEFIEKAFALGVTELALLLKSTFWHAKRRFPLFQKHTPSYIMPLLWRPDFLQLGAPTMEAMWCVWSPSPQSGEPIYRPIAQPLLK